MCTRPRPKLTSLPHPRPPLEILPYLTILSHTPIYSQRPSENASANIGYVDFALRYLPTLYASSWASICIDTIIGIAL